MLKVGNDGLTKAWKPFKTWEPFYKGGKIESTKDGSKYVCEYDGNVKIVDSHDPSTLTNLIDSDEEHESISTFCLHPNGSEIVVATEKFNIMHFSLDDRTSTRTIKAHRMPILCMQYDPTGTLVATGSSDRSVRVWDIAKGHCTHSFTKHTDIVKTVMFHPDPQKLLLFSTSEDNSICMYDLRDQQCVAQFRDHFSLPTQLAISPDGYTLVSASRDKVLNFYELREKELIKTIPIMEELEAVVVFNEEMSKAVLNGPTVSSGLKKKAKVSEQSVLVTAGAQGILRVYAFEMKGKDVSTFSITHLYNLPLSQIGHLTNVAQEIAALKGVSSLLLNSTESRITAITNDFNFCSFDMEQFHELVQAAKADKEISMRPKELVVSNHGDVLDMIRIPHSSEAGMGLNYRLALVTNSPQLRIIDEKLNCVVLEGHSDIILSADVSPDGLWMVTSAKDRTCRLWNLEKNECRAIGEGHTDPVGAVCMSHNPVSYASRKVFMISGAGDKILKRWTLALHTLDGSAVKVIGQSDVKKLTSSHSIRAHDKDINCVTVSPNDMMVASASQDKSIRLWNTEDLTPVATLNGHKRGVWKVVFSPVDKILVSCSGDRTVKLWSVVDYSIVRTLEGHTASVLNAKFVNHGTQLISSSADGLIRLWTIRSGECENTFEDHQDRVWALESLQLQANETKDTETSNLALKYFCSAGSDSKIILWGDVTEEEEMKRLSDAEDMLVLEQQMQNDLRNKNYGKALKLALTLGHPSKVLNILTYILEDDKDSTGVEVKDLFKQDWSLRLDPYVLEMNEEELKKILSYLKEWNTNSRNCYTCQLLLNSVFRVIKVNKLLTFKEVREMTAGVAAYTERHYQRINRLSQATHFIDYIVSLVNIMPMESINAIAVQKPIMESTSDVENDKPVNEESVVDDKTAEKEELMEVPAEEVATSNDKRKSTRKRKAL